uniref:Uncharacterized protein n=1 Tax=Romanomermis culicivorax TaxID=13658 RepID=A0A915J8I2_ROMCU
PINQKWAYDKLVTVPANLKVEETLKFAKNRKSQKLPESTRKMEENRRPCSTAMGCKKVFYKKVDLLKGRINNVLRYRHIFKFKNKRYDERERSDNIAGINIDVVLSQPTADV